MIKNIKLLKYGYQFGLNIFSGIIFILFGIIQRLFLWPGNPATYMFPLVGCLFIIQIASSMEISGFIKSSPKFRMFYLGISRVTNIAGFIIYFAILVITGIIHEGSWEIYQQNAGNELAIAGIIYIIMVLYTSIVFKYLVVPSVMLFIVFFIMGIVEFFIRQSFCLDILQGAAAATGCFVIGMLLSELARRALYTKQLSKYSIGRSLRKYYF